MKNQYKREVLYNEIWQQPVTTVAKKYSVSDVAIRKVCKAMNIPLPPRGYWAKLAAGQKVERTPLPKNHDGPDEKLGRRPHQWSCGHPKVDALDIDDEQKLALVKAIEYAQQVDFQTVELNSTMQSYLAKMKDWDTRPNSRVSGRPQLSKTLTPACYDRALKIVQVVGEALKLIDGYVDEDLFIHLGGEQIRYAIREQTNRTLNPEYSEEKVAEALAEEYDYQPPSRKWIVEPNSLLAFAIMERRYIRDYGDKTLEGQLDAILIALFKAVEQAREERLQIGYGVLEAGDQLQDAFSSSASKNE